MLLSRYTHPHKSPARRQAPPTKSQRTITFPSRILSHLYCIHASTHLHAHIIPGILARCCAHGKTSGGAVRDLCLLLLLLLMRCYAVYPTENVFIIQQMFYLKAYLNHHKRNWDCRWLKSSHMCASPGEFYLSIYIYSAKREGMRIALVSYQFECAWCLFAHIEKVTVH